MNESSICMNKVYNYVVVEKCEGNSELRELFSTYKEALAYAKAKKTIWEVDKISHRLNLNIDWDVVELTEIRKTPDAYF
jgi:hypothetical protein